MLDTGARDAIPAVAPKLNSVEDVHQKKLDWRKVSYSNFYTKASDLNAQQSQPSLGEYFSNAMDHDRVFYGLQ